MGKHGNQDNGKQETPNPGYEPKHSGGQDGYEWAQTVQPVDQKKEKK
jgi:hypothetical protein